MLYDFRHKNINFTQFVQKLKDFSDFLEINRLQVEQNYAEFETDRSLLGFRVLVCLFPAQNGLEVNIDMSNVIKWIIVFLLIFLLVFKVDFYVFLLFAVFFSIFFWFVNLVYIKGQLKKLFSTVEQKEVMNIREGEQKFVKERQRGLRCPACGEQLTIFDEFCPSCGLYFGPPRMKQSADRTSYFDYRLIYQYKEKHNTNTAQTSSSSDN